MKKLFILSLYSLISFTGISQAVIADPAVNVMQATNISELPIDPLLIPVNSILELKVPIVNYNTTNAIPPGSCKIKIGLGSKLIIDPAFSLSNSSTSNYFNWSSEVVGGQVLITGDLYASLPQGFIDTLTLRLTGVILGTSTVTTNFLVTNHNTNIFLSDENGNNNNTALTYNIVTGTVPVDFIDINVAKEQCNLKVDFYTANEVNVRHFEIEGSKNGRDFEIIGILNAAQLGHYHFLFAITNVIASPQYFIRIKSVDFDQQYKYSNIYLVNASCDEKSSYVVFPNPVPVSGSLIKIRSENGIMDGNYKLTIIDMMGKILQRKRITISNDRVLIFDHNQLPAGQYLIIIKKNEENPVYLKFQKL